MSSNPIRNILFISRCHNTYQRQLNLDEMLIPSEMMLISQICRQPGITQREILKNLGIDKSRVSHLLKNLEEKGYVRREPSEADARSIAVYPMENARRIYPHIRDNHLKFLERVLAGLDANEVQELTRLTEMIRKNAEEAIQEKRKP